jgi:hypothetical protein
MADLHSALHFHPETLPTRFRSQVIGRPGERVIASCHIESTVDPYVTVHSVYGRPSDLRAYAAALNAAADLGEQREKGTDQQEPAEQAGR